MCSNLKLSKTQNIVPKGTAVYKIYTHGGKIAQVGTWGFANGIYYNSRVEKTTNNSPFNRGIIEIDSFLERGIEVYVPDSRMTLAIIYNSKHEFSVLTEDSAGIVATIHHRMPVILDDSSYAIDRWLIDGTITHKRAFDLRIKLNNKRA